MNGGGYVNGIGKKKRKWGSEGSELAGEVNGMDLGSKVLIED